MTNRDELPVAIIGGGPVGLAAAAHLIGRGIKVKLYESGDAVAANVRDWGHVRLFSPWRFNTDAAARALLLKHGWQEPQGAGLPSGHDLRDVYLEPLANTPEMRAAIETKAEVIAVSRQGLDKVVSRDRAARPFALRVRNGTTRIDLARAVIDASGTWQNPNPLGADGMPAIGESEHVEHIAYGIPDILGAERAAYEGHRVLVIGGGHSAANALLDLARLAESNHAMQLIWALRGENRARVFGGGAADQLSARGQLGSDLRALVESGRLNLVAGFSAKRIDDAKGGGLAVTGATSKGDVMLGPVDRIIVATGQRPGLRMTRELRLDLDPWLECSRALGPSIDPNLHSCGSVPPHGYKELAHPEPDFFTVGVKSYGRAPTFLMATGYEQVRSVAAYLAGDMAAANDVRLVLPETGVCSLDTSSQDADACCGGPAPSPEACCADDAAAKAAGQSGCGCAPEPKISQPTNKTCCGARSSHA